MRDQQSTPLGAKPFTEETLAKVRRNWAEHPEWFTYRVDMWLATLDAARERLSALDVELLHKAIVNLYPQRNAERSEGVLWTAADWAEAIAAEYARLDAARERPSALNVDVELMTDAWKNVLEAFGPRVLIRQNVMLLLAEYARLTEPDAGEGTEPCFCHPGFLHCPDTTEATPNPDRVTIHDHVEWAHHVRSEHEATHSEPEMCGAGCAALGLIEFDDEDAGEGTER